MTDLKDLCPLCGRPLGTVLLEEHHLVPKCKGGKVTTTLHKQCHRAIHAVLAEKELKKTYSTAEALLTHPEIVKFVAWIAKKPPEFYVGMDETASRKSKRRR